MSHEPIRVARAAGQRTAEQPRVVTATEAELRRIVVGLQADVARLGGEINRLKEHLAEQDTLKLRLAEQGRLSGILRTETAALRDDARRNGERLARLEKALTTPRVER